MEAHIVKAVELMGKAGENMLARVVLHAAVALLPVKAAAVGAGLQGRVAIMYNLACLFVDFFHADRANKACVGKLSAALGEECGLVQNHGEALFVLCTGKNLCFKLVQVAVGIIKLFSHFYLL